MKKEKKVNKLAEYLEKRRKVVKYKVELSGLTEEDVKFLSERAYAILKGLPAKQ